MESLLLLLPELYAGGILSEILDGLEYWPLFGRLSRFSFSTSDLSGRCGVNYLEKKCPISTFITTLLINCYLLSQFKYRRSIRSTGCSRIVFVIRSVPLRST